MARLKPCSFDGCGEVRWGLDGLVPEVSFVEGDAVLHQEGAEFFFK